MRSASRGGSIGERLFLNSWSALDNGVDVEDVMRSCVTATAAASVLGDIDSNTLHDLDVAPEVAARILQEAARSVRSLPWFGEAAALPQDQPAPGFAVLLAHQPRAGITCPGRPRIILEPPENHAEHCWAVAVFGVALAQGFGADPVTVWLAGMAHHLHNAFLPDSGFAGEVLLGDQLEPVMQRATERALDGLSPDLRDRVRNARHCLADAETPEGRAFHAADTLDRVWQIDQHLRAGRLDLNYVLNDMALVHDGPVKAFQDELLRAAGLLT